MASSSTPMVDGPRQARPKVFINFRGDLRNSFVCHLEDALKHEGISYFIDTMADPGDEMINLFNHIEESKVALAVFSEGYSESNWCLNELVKIMERVDEKKLRIFPICFHVKVGDVKNQTGKFGENLRKGEGRDLSNMHKWKKALQSVSGMVALRLVDGRTESDFIAEVVSKLKNVIALIEREEGTNMVSTNISSMSSIGNASSGDIIQPLAPFPYVVPGLNDKEALQLFSHHAFNGQDYDHPQRISLKCQKDLWNMPEAIH